MKLGISVFLIATLLTASLPLSDIHAQSLNNRKTAPPSSKALKMRAISEARRQAGGVSSRNTINTDCSDLHIGAKQDDKRANRISSRKKEVVVVTGNVTNVCR